MTLQVYTRAQLPQQWAATQNNLGTVLSDLGTRTGGEEGAKLLAQAVTAYENALEVRTRAQLPQDWAMTQNNLGTVLSGLGTRTGGEAGAALLGQAVVAYQNALQVYSIENLPIDWARAHYNLGRVFYDLGILTGGEEGLEQLKKAIDAYQETLKVISPYSYPERWISTQKTLAEIYFVLQDLPNVAECYANMLQVDPDYEEAYQTAGYLNHEVLFNFPEAFALNQQWLERHPEDLSAQCDFAEKHFTTGRFVECEKRVAALLANPEIVPPVKIALRAIETANLLALNKAEQVQEKLEVLQQAIASQPDTFKVTWSFAGSKHFVSQHEPLAPYRAWLLQLFEALEIKEGKEAILAALWEVRKNFRIQK